MNSDQFKKRVAPRYVFLWAGRECWPSPKNLNYATGYLFSGDTQRTFCEFLIFDKKKKK